MEYLIWCDESDSKGKLYSNFYGGVLVKSKDYEYVQAKLLVAKKENNFFDEIKWQKVTTNYLEKYIKVMDIFFDLIKQDLVKVRIMFTKNNVFPKNLSSFHQENEFFLLYYQFIKHGFGLADSNTSNKDINLRIYFDYLPNSIEKRESFKGYIKGLNENKSFREARIKIKPENIVEVISHKHILIQFLDIVLGSMSFYLNEKYKNFNPITNQQGNRTIAKEKLCKHILDKIHEICPKFNANATTDVKNVVNLWQDKYRHWCFTPENKEVTFE